MKPLILCLTALAACPVHADSELARVALTDVYKKECGGCHAPFPPGLLNAADWRKTLAGLDRHFGTDASLDAKSGAEIANWLARHAGRGVGASPDSAPRITTTRNFLREHDEVPARVWKDPKVKTAANCAACHPGADQGRYGERELALPGIARHRER